MIASYSYRREVRFAETDASGFAYFDTYIRMMEETEYAFLRSRGLRVVLHDDRGIIGFPRIHANIEVHSPLRFTDCADVKLHLAEIDGKHIVYDFDVTQGTKTVACGRFKVACCRFPKDDVPYAILTPDFVSAKLTAS